MALPVEHLPRLRVIDGGSSVMRIEEAHVEAISFCDEVVNLTARIVDAVTGLPVPSMVAIDTANRLAHRAMLARAELMALGPKGAA